MLIVDPYKKRPKPPSVALLHPSGTVITENGNELDLSNFPSHYRVWGFPETVRRLVRDGNGQALYWQKQPIKWRHFQAEEEGWKRRASDVFIINVPEPGNWDKAIRGLATWRDWLASYGASPTGTTGSASYSLLKATVRRKTLWLGSGEIPPLYQVIGGRQQLGCKGIGSFTGTIEHRDISAAYATELGNICYGGWWYKNSDCEFGSRSLDWWAKGGNPVFVRAKVRVPRLMFGPLPVRPKGIEHPFFSALAVFDTPERYPVGKTIQGFWTLEELQAAEEAGCKILKILEIWGHRVPDIRPFSRWWYAIQKGRDVDDRFARTLAKMTGNSLWGRLCMTQTSGRTIRYRTSKGKIEFRKLPPLPIGNRNDLALAETVSGRVRAKLFRFMLESGDALLSAHTDGAWRYRMESPPLEEWARKASATRLDILGPQTLRYWKRNALEPVYVVSGVIPEAAPEVFNLEWEKYERAHTTP